MDLEWAPPDDFLLGTESFALGLPPPFEVVADLELKAPTLDLLTVAPSPPSSPDSGFPSSPGHALLQQAQEGQPPPVDIVPMVPHDAAAANNPNKRQRTVGSTSISIDPQVLEEQNLKKQRRMLKNRESACLSRRRKKEHMEGLERQVNEAAQEKDALLARIAALEAENVKLKSELDEARGWRSKPAVTAATATGTTCLLVFIAVFSLFTPPTASPLVHQTHHGLVPLGPAPARTLKSIAQIAAVPHSSALSTPKPSGTRLASIHPPANDLAPRALPSKRTTDGTHDDIDLWVQQQRAKLQGGRDHDLTTDFTLSPNATLPPLFRLSDRLTVAMLESLQLKPDTSYIFCTEARIFSARTANAEQPRMSVIMPAPALAPAKTNATVVTNNAIQVDCDILQSTPLAFNQTNVVVG